MGNTSRQGCQLGEVRRRGRGVVGRLLDGEPMTAVCRERGLPGAIRSDNGVPFASPTALFNLSKLALWRRRLGIAIERIKPGHPRQNGRHERMHLTLKREATRPPGINALQQQARFDAFRTEFNTERPHQALAMRCPAELYATSIRPYHGLPEIAYPPHDREILVTACGRVCISRPCGGGHPRMSATDESARSGKHMSKFPSAEIIIPGPRLYGVSRTSRPAQSSSGRHNTSAGRPGTGYRGSGSYSFRYQLTRNGAISVIVRHEGAPRPLA
jgi:integrase-like protein